MLADPPVIQVGCNGSVGGIGLSKRSKQFAKQVTAQNSNEKGSIFITKGPGCHLLSPRTLLEPSYNQEPFSLWIPVNILTGHLFLRTTCCRARFIRFLLGSIPTTFSFPFVRPKVFPAWVFPPASIGTLPIRCMPFPQVFGRL